MSSCNSEGVAEFNRLISELEDFISSMNSYEKKFMYENIGNVEKYGDKLVVSEAQLEFARKLYRETL